MQEIVVIGSGFSGSILARRIAEELNQKVLVVEARRHIGGNAHDEYDEYGILIQKYGPHFLNTNNYSIIKYLKKYATLVPHCAKLLSYIDDQYIRLPFNFESIQQLIGAESAEKLLGCLRTEFYGRDRVPILELVDSEIECIRDFGNLLFEKSYKTYTSKMWGLDVSQVDKYVLDRVPMAMNYDERYLNKDFQYLPLNGFYEIFDNLLTHENIEVKLNTNAMDYITFNSDKVLFAGEEVKCLIFTGAIDELLGYRYGALPYRSLDIKYEYSEADRILPEEVISYPQAIGYTRSTEYKSMTMKKPDTKMTVVATEYPLQFDKDAKIGNIRYYPVNTVESNSLYEKYLADIKHYGNIFLCGRLAEFKYYNMDICIEHALEYFDDIKQYLIGKDNEYTI